MLLNEKIKTNKLKNEIENIYINLLTYRLITGYLPLNSFSHHLTSIVFIDFQ